MGISAAAIPVTLLESELFGHEKGAFTDAKDRRLGKLELAHGGTVFFDEIGDMPPELQVKLLRALQERSFERVGGHELIRMDVRVLAATHRDLEGMMREGRFREDLFYRLNVVMLSLPSLRERRGDIPLLVEHMLAKYAESLGERVIAADALDRLVGYAWPGNVRELENVIQRAMVMASAGVILPEHLPIGPVSRPPPSSAPMPRSRRSSRRRCTSAFAGCAGTPPPTSTASWWASSRSRCSGPSCARPRATRSARPSSSASIAIPSERSSRSTGSTPAEC